MKIWNKFKTWIIHKFGGKTQEEYNIDIKNFKAEYNMTHPAEIRCVNRYPRKEIFRYDFVVPDESVYDMDEFMASEEAYKIRRHIIFGIAEALFDGNYVHFEKNINFVHYEKNMRATLCVLKWEDS